MTPDQAYFTLTNPFIDVKSHPTKLARLSDISPNLPATGTRALGSFTMSARNNSESSVRRNWPDHYPAMPPKQDRPTSPRAQSWIIWSALVGMFLPYSFGTTGKYVVAPLFPLALIRFLPAVFRGSRRMMSCDLFVFAAGLWMIAAEITTTGSLSLATGSDAFGFVGAYMVARAFIFGERSTREFIRAFRFTTIALIALSILDTFSGRFFINDVVAVIFRDAAPIIVKGAGDIHRQLFGFSTIRATSTFAHPILFGSFCSLAAAIFLYSEQRLIWRAFYVGACFMGCVLSISSAPLLAFAIIVSVNSYDRILKRYPLRWKALWAILIGSGFILFLLSNRPLGFVFDHFTFTPETGYYRVLIWQHAIDYITIAPFTGDHFAWLSDDILGDSVDSVWLVLSLLFGLPVAFFLLLATLAACGWGGRGKGAFLNFEMQRLRTGFSLVLAMFVFLGLTVHFWASMWLFWGFCIGIRASIGEYSHAEGRVKQSERRQIRLQSI